VIARDVERFLTKVNFNGPKIIDTPCWLYTGSLDQDGYGRIGIGQVTVTAHRFAHMMVNGPIGKGLVVRHRCDNPTCVNPAHLLDGTHRDNANDAIMRMRTGKCGGKRLSVETRTEIKRLIAEGMTQRAIATKLGISVKTAGNWSRRKSVKNAKHKIGCMCPVHRRASTNVICQDTKV
jgi:Autographiviridae endonuclease